MSGSGTEKRDSFGSNIGAIAAIAGSAIGLGNIWRFPYVAGENGGGAFLLIYIVFILLIGIPVMTSEFIIGRSAQKNPYGAFRLLAPGKPWFLIGVMGVLAAFFILSFYTTVSGWTLEYFYQAITGNLSGKTNRELAEMFTGFLNSPFRPYLWFLIFMGLTALIIISGVKNGIERYAKILMPFLLVLLVILCIRAITLKGANEGLRFLFHPDVSKITPKVILEALGQGFFSLSIGMGTLITYGSYIRKKDNLASTALYVTASDTIIAILAGVAIFPAVFALGGTPASGSGLTFIVLPEVFQKLPFGNVIAMIFFILLAIAALTSTISVLEVIVAFLVEELKMVRRKATIVASVSVSVLGLLTVASMGKLGSFTILGKNIFGLLEYLTANIMLPLGGLLIVIFIGWFHDKNLTKLEMTNNGEIKSWYFPVYFFLVRYIAPVAIALVFLYSLGIINF
ncbi:MAG TPA: sodium-dependent transporter [Bacteroidales bacterium]|nr:sodium-dependent transporter [Bacteroidales bacterium]HQK71151.1 sodium-dependent transporter [Bacteroidales bacterium]